jgi:hypothetical protein
MTDQWAPLVDVGDMSIEQIMAAIEPGTPIKAALDRVLKDLNDPDGVISAFQSHID